jgi:TonB family protein
MTEHQTEIETSPATSAQLEHAPVVEGWKSWEGRVVNGEFPLHRFLGGSGHSAVFLTNYGGVDGLPAAIKLILEDPEKSQQQLERWALASGLSHPNLLRLFQAGRCELDGLPLLYVVTEYAEEDLSQIIPQRALNPLEAREMLRPTLDALSYLHGMGLVHGRIKPANIMACGDQVKLSIDGICQADTGNSSLERPAGPENPDRYAPPERKPSPAADSWALGMALVEVLTQQLPAWERSSAEAEPAIPETLAQPFHQIARRCLRRNPALRLKMSHIASQLEPLPAQEQAESARVNEPSEGSNFLAGLAAIAVLLTAIWASSLGLRREAHVRQAPSAASDTRKLQKSSGQPAVAKLAVTASGGHHPSAKSQSRPAIQTVGLRKTPVAETPAAEGIHPVLPQAPQKALDTIHGTVRVRVKVQVNPAGHVSEAELDSPGPSRYFANLALHAARQWTFANARTANPDHLRAWILHFAFSSSGVQARPIETTS